MFTLNGEYLINILNFHCVITYIAYISTTKKKQMKEQLIESAVQVIGQLRAYNLHLSNEEFLEAINDAVDEYNARYCQMDFSSFENDN